MPTDDERREIARRLRRSARSDKAVSIHIVGRHLGLEMDADYMYGTMCNSESVERLADLIDPGDPKVRCVAEVKIEGDQLDEAVHRAVAEYMGIDRDALLELADELEAQQTNKGMRQVGPYMQPGDAARRIREACGEAS